VCCIHFFFVFLIKVMRAYDELTLIKPDGVLHTHTHTRARARKEDLLYRSAGVSRIRVPKIRDGQKVTLPRRSLTNRTFATP